MSDQPTIEGMLGTPPKTIEDMLGPKPDLHYYGLPGPVEAGQALGNYLATTGAGRILHAFGQGAANGWGADGLWSPEAEQTMRKAGIFNDTDASQRTLVKSANEALLRPLAVGLDAAYRASSAAFAAAQAGVAQIGAEAGMPELGRDIAALPEAFPFGMHEVPHVPGEAPVRAAAPYSMPPDFERARALNVIGPGGEAAWKGVTEPAANENVVRSNVEAAKEAAPEPGAAEAPTPPAPPTVHEVARQVAPHVFAEYDPLVQQRDTIRDRLAAMSEQNRADHEAHAPHAAEIADLEDRLQDTTPRLAKKYQARLDDMVPARDAWLDANPVRDSEDMARLRRLLLETDYRMRDLAPDVTAAYAEAGRRMPVETPEPTPTAAVHPEPTGAVPDVAPGMARFYHGGNEYQGGSRWLTPDFEYAKGYADKSGGMLHYVDVAESDPHLIKAFDDTGTGHVAPYVHFDAPEEIARNLKPVEPGHLASLRAEREARLARLREPAPVAAAPAEAPAPASPPPGAPTPETPKPSIMTVPDIAADVQQKLVAARQTVEHAQATAALWAAHYASRAKEFEGRLGSAEDLYAREAPDIAFKETGGPGGEGKGKVRFREKEIAQGGDSRATPFRAKPILTLFGKGDASTLIHETGHTWLRELLSDAANPQAPEGLKARATVAKQWMGVGADDKIAPRHEEKFARGFERYMMEGTAPTRALAGVFEKFKNWLTDIYRSVAGLKVSITPDIRDVFDRLLTTEVDRGTVAPERAEPAPRAEPEAPKRYSPYDKVPKEPTRLVSFLRKIGGVRDDGGDVKQLIGGHKGLPGLINSTGRTLDDAALKAWEHGYFPELGTDRPTINQLLDAMDEDLRGNPKYSIHDQGRVEDFNDAVQRNSEIDRLAQEHGIDQRGLTREQFYARVAEKLGKDAAAEEGAQQEHAAKAEAYDMSLGLQDLDEEHGAEPTEIGEPRTLEDLEREQREADAASDREHGSYGTEEAGPPGRSASAGDVGEGQGGGGDGAATGSGNAVAGAGRRPTNAQDGFGEPASDLIDKAGNIRLDNLNGPEDVNRLLRQMAEQHGDYMEARRGVIHDADVIAMANVINASDAEMNARILRTKFLDDPVPLAARARALRMSVVQQAARLREVMTKAVASKAPADVFAAVVEANRLNMIQETLSGVTAEWGRGGRGFRDLAEEVRASENLGALMKDTTGRTLFQMQEQMEMALKAETPAQLAKFSRDMMKPDFWDMASEYLVNALISNPVTHLTYAVGTELLTLWRAVPETALRAAAGSLAEAFRGEKTPGAPREVEIAGERYQRPQGSLGLPHTDEPIEAPPHEMPWSEGERAYFGEVRAGLYGMMRGSKMGLHAAGRALYTGEQIKLPGEAMAAVALQKFQHGAIPGKVGEVIRLPGRMVSAIHALGRFQNYAMAISQMAYRTAMREGLTGDDFTARIANLEMNPPPEMMALARGEATSTALMGRGGEFSKAVVQLANSRLLGTKLPKMIIPFAQVSSNIMSQGLIERTPLGFASPDVRANLRGEHGPVARDAQIARIVAGSTLGITALTMAAQGTITGAEPADPKERAIWRAEGKQAYSIRVGNTWYSYARLGVMAKPVGMAADLWQVGEAMAEKDLSTITPMIAMSFSRLVLDESSMKGLADALDAAEDSQRSGLRWAKSFLTGFIPFSMAVNQVAREVDPWDRQARTMLDAFQARIPGLSEGLPQRIDIWGQPIPARSTLGGLGITSIYTSREKNDPVTRVLAELQKRGVPVWPAMPERRIRGVELTDQQYEAYARSAGLLAHQRLEPMVTSAWFSAVPGAEQANQIHSVIESARKQAQDEIIIRSYGGANDIMAKANAAKAKKHGF